MEFDPNEYRQRLNLALTDTSQIGVGPVNLGYTMPQLNVQPRQPMIEPELGEVEPKKKEGGGGMNLGALSGMMGGMMGGGGGGTSMMMDTPSMGGGTMYAANGGRLRPGRTIVGEQGPEAIEMDAGGNAVVVPTQNLRAGVQGGSGVAPATPGINPMAGQGSDEPGMVPVGAKPKIPTKPPDLVEDVDPEKLKAAKTPAELFDAASKSNQQDYMKWWEGQYGAINQRFDKMNGDLGSPPELAGKFSKKEKFTWLLHFGAQLTRHFQDPMADSGTAVPGALMSGFEGVAGEREQNLAKHEKQSAQIEAQRAEALKGIGTPAEARKAASEEELSSARAENLRRGEAAKVEEIIETDEGKFAVMTDGSVKPLDEVRGNIKQRGLGGRSGSAGTRTPAPANIEKIANFYARTYGLPIQVATDIARAEKTSRDPFTMYDRIVNGELARYSDDPEEMARKIVEGLYGAGALEERPNSPRSDDPLGIRRQ